MISGSHHHRSSSLSASAGATTNVSSGGYGGGHDSRRHNVDSPTSTYGSEDSLLDGPNDLSTSGKDRSGHGGGHGSVGYPYYSPPHGGHHHHHHSSSSSQQSPFTATNDCRIIEYRGHRIAAFLSVATPKLPAEYLLCLPQAFELFLKHLVGGLHTVYTKLKVSL